MPRPTLPPQGRGPWSVYERRGTGQHIVKPYDGRRGLVGIFVDREEARAYARERNRRWVEEQAAKKAAKQRTRGGGGCS